MLNRLSKGAAKGVFGLLFAAMFASCGGADTDTEGSTCGGFDEECRSCRTEGSCCKFSINCAAGSICNDPADPLFVAEKGAGVCVKVVCAGDNDCQDGKTCNLEKLCQSPVCQTNSDCAGNQQCLSGQCAPAIDTNLVASCQVLTQAGVLKQGNTIELAALAKNAAGTVLPRIAFTWKSDNLTAISIGDGNAVGGASAGNANVTASVTGTNINCAGKVVLQNFADIAQGTARVVLISAKTGLPVSNADVWITDAASAEPHTGKTGVDGSYVLPVLTGTIQQVTVGRTGFQFVTVMKPSKPDIIIAAAELVDITTAGGIRGNVDISGTKKGDIKLALVGPSLPANILDLQLQSIIGDFVPTTIDAPDLGVSKQEVGLPGGLMLGLGEQVFTNDSAGANVRCQGNAPSASQLGCYLTRGPAGAGSAWVLGGQVKLSAVSALAGQLSSVISGGDFSKLDIPSLLTGVLPLVRQLNHGVSAGINIENFPKVNKAGQSGLCSDANLADYDTKCEANYAKYVKTDIALDASLGILSAVSVPTLPKRPDDSAFVNAAVVVGGTLVPGRGLLPLGLGAGLDVKKAEAPDGKVFGMTEPFGPNSTALSDGQVALALAPAHGGIEGGKLMLVALALNIDATAKEFGPIELSANVERVSRFNTSTAITGAFLGFPRGTFDRTAWTVVTNKTVAEAGITRYQFSNAGREWLVYAPHSNETIVLPNVASARNAVGGDKVALSIQVVKADASYEDLFRFGSNKTVERLGDTTKAFVLVQCTVDAPANAACKIQ